MKSNNSGPKNLSNEFGNDTHIVKKKKAIQTQFQKKNLKDIVELMDEEDDELAETYARYIK